MANNERIWFPVDNKYASLDRRNSSTKKLQIQSAKAISTGNIDLTSSSDDAEARRREKKWYVFTFILTLDVHFMIYFQVRDIPRRARLR